MTDIYMQFVERVMNSEKASGLPTKIECRAAMNELEARIVNAPTVSDKMQLRSVQVFVLGLYPKNKPSRKMRL
jgi:hypothetical protein